MSEVVWHASFFFPYEELLDFVTLLVCFPLHVTIIKINIHL